MARRVGGRWERSLKRHGGGSNCRDCSTPLSRFRLLEVAGNDRRATLRRASLRRKEGISCLPSSYPFSAQARLGPRWANLSSRLTALHFSGWRASSFPLRSNVDFLSPLCCSRISTPPREARAGTLGLQQQGRIFFFAYPALIPQRGSAPRKCDRATIGRPWRGWSIADERLFR
jgi:hypothetical protein